MQHTPGGIKQNTAIQSKVYKISYTIQNYSAKNRK